LFISRIKLQNFRNFESLDLFLNQGFVVFVGQNGAGKTNLLESIYYNLSLRRFPDSDFLQLFANGKEFFRVVVEAFNQEKQTREAFAQKTASGFRHNLEIGGRKVKRREYIKAVAVISFLPQDLALFTGSPSRRRSYLDEALSGASALYEKELRDYNKILKQRNALLSEIVEKGAKESELAVWDETLARHGSNIIKKRQEFFEFIQKNRAETLRSISPKLIKAEFIYKPAGEADESSFKRSLAAKRRLELASATTVVGPHRDDFMVFIGGEKGPGILSRGELRALTVALKMVETSYIESRKGAKPILLLDDVFSEFDTEHQKSLAEFLREQNQIFLTTAHLAEIEKYLPAEAQIFKIGQGEIKS